MGKGANLVVLLIIPFLLINSASAILFLWNGTNSTVPENFTCVSCYYTDPFYEMYPRINTTRINESFYDLADFPYLHSHTARINMTYSSANVTASFGSVNGFNRASSGHIHTSATLSPAINNIKIVPYTKSLLVIYARDNITYLPVGVIAFFNSTVAPENFSLFTDNDGSLIMGNLTKTTFGNFTHSHMNINITTSNPNALANGEIGLKASVSLTTHKHSLYNQNFTLESHIPAFVNMPLIIVVNYTYIPKGVIAMFDSNSFPSGWVNATSGLQNRFIWANSTSFNTTGGNFTHTHPSVYGVTTTSSLNDNLLFCGPFCGNWPSSGHTHIATVGLSNASNLPPYRNVAIAVFNGTPIIPPVIEYNRTVVFDWPSWYVKEQREKQRMTSIYLFIGYTIFLSVGFLMIWRQYRRKKLYN